MLDDRLVVDIRRRGRENPTIVRYFEQMALLYCTVLRIRITLFLYIYDTPTGRGEVGKCSARTHNLVILKDPFKSRATK